jgi:hypothetical protein
MCWGKLPRHPGRALALPLCGPWPRPHLAAAKLVELRSSVNLVAMPHQPLDRPVASLNSPGLFRGRLLRRLAAAPGTGSARKARSASGTKKLPPGDHRPHVCASWGDHFLMPTTKNLIRCQIPPQQGAAVDSGNVTATARELGPSIPTGSSVRRKRSAAIARQTATAFARIANQRAASAASQ